MSNFNADLAAVKTIVNGLDGNKVLRMAYTQTAYDNDEVAGVDSYNYAEDQNVPNASAVSLDPIVADKGLQTQGASLPRDAINHFFGRLSYNLNKLVAAFNVALATILRALTQNGSRYDPAAEYLFEDVCSFLVSDGGVTLPRDFIRVSNVPEKLINTPPVNELGEINTTHWRMIYPTDTITQAAGTNNTKIASTAFVRAITDALSSTKANIDSPAFTGVPTAPSPDAEASGNQLATASWVRSLMSSGMSLDFYYTAGVIPVRSLQVFYTTGAHTWNKPTGCQRIIIIITGAGGGGGGGDKQNKDSGGGGGSGAVAALVMNVAEIDSLELTLGAGGSGRSEDLSGYAGGASTVDGLTIGGGAGGARGGVSDNVGGAGGIVSGAPVNGILCFNISGGAGGNGVDRGSTDPSAPGGAGGLPGITPGAGTGNVQSELVLGGSYWLYEAITVASAVKESRLMLAKTLFSSGLDILVKNGSNGGGSNTTVPGTANIGEQASLGNYTGPCGGAGGWTAYEPSVSGGNGVAVFFEMYDM